MDHLFKQSLQVALAILLTNERGPSVTDEELKALEVALRAEDFPPEAWQARFALRNSIFIPVIAVLSCCALSLTPRSRKSAPPGEQRTVRTKTEPGRSRGPEKF